MKNTFPFYILFKVLKVPLIKICKIQPPHLLFLVVFVLLAFTSADIIFHKFLELHSTLSEKNFITSFPFLTDSLKPPTPLTTKIHKTKRDKSFLSMLP